MAAEYFNDMCTVDDLLPGEITHLLLLGRRHRVVGREEDLLRLEPVAHVLLSEVPAVDGEPPQHDQRHREHHARRADQLVPHLPVHLVPPLWDAYLMGSGCPPSRTVEGGECGA